MSSSSLLSYDVFISFRADDTRKTFVSHLYRSLEQKGFTVFKDENELGRDGPISDKIIEAIRKTRFAVVVMSENYASSVGCLETLANIVEFPRFRPQGRGSTAPAITVLYEVGMSDLVVPEAATFNEGLRRLGGINARKVNQWKYALFTALNGSSPALHSRHWEDDSMLVDTITDRITGELSATRSSPLSDLLDAYEASKEHIHKPTTNPTFISKVDDHISPARSITSVLGFASYESGSDWSPSPYVSSTRSTRTTSSGFNGLVVGMDTHVKEVNPLLDLGSSKEVRVIGITGMGGVGKSTLARHVYELISQHFETHCFLRIPAKAGQGHVKPPRLLEELLKREATTTRISKVSSDVERVRLGHRKVLLVADGVDNIDQLKDVMEDARLFGPGSRVILTTKKKSSLDECGVKHIYEIGYMRYDEALQLFCQSAFKQNHLPNRFQRLSVRAVQLAGRLPLALKVFGSYLHGRDEEDWERALRSLEQEQDQDTMAVYNHIAEHESGRRTKKPMKLERSVGADKQDKFPSYYFSFK